MGQVIKEWSATCITQPKDNLTHKKTKSFNTTVTPAVMFDTSNLEMIVLKLEHDFWLYNSISITTTEQFIL